MDITDTTVMYNGSNKAAYGSYLYGSGPADELVVSLGDHGSALLGFDIPIVNRAGPDFAVFENSFGDGFLELGFVEVSSDGQRFVRFPAVSLTPYDQQVNTFDTIDATKINNFAGKYKHGFGTPFNLDDLSDSAGIDLNHIIQIRVTDVIGCLRDSFATFDSQGHKVNDPWPTPFDTGGFDFDAIGVIHNQTEGQADGILLPRIALYPNPAVGKVTIDLHSMTGVNMQITDLAGKVLLLATVSAKTTVDLSSLNQGIYLALFTAPDGSSTTMKIIKY
ncbi:MAG: T9SS type A sorting domain-containing protein [Bacteroidales bacterium]